MSKPQTFCTISTKSHVYKSFALAKSLEAFGGNLVVLLVDGDSVNKDIPANTSFLYLADLQEEIAQAIIQKYRSSADKLRWCLKPVLLKYLLAKNDKVIYVDNDIHFLSSFDFLFDILEDSSILLTPHDYPRDPTKNQNWFEANFRVGLYNAGFVGVSKKALPTLEWWGNACLYRCEKNYWRGLFDDQKYLDLIPIIDENYHIVRHPGCNASEWNASIRKRTYENGQHIISGKYPLVFYHFNQYAINQLDTHDPLWQEYLACLSNYQEDHNKLPKQKNQSCIDDLKLFLWKILDKFNQ